MEKIGDTIARLSIPKTTGQTSTQTYVKPLKPVCPLCRGAGYVVPNVPFGDPSFGKAMPCECKEREIEAKWRNHLRRLSNIEPFADKTFENFDYSVPGVKEAYLAAKKFAQEQQGWLLLAGRYGCGKTHLAAAIANYAIGQGVPLLFTIVPDLLDHLRSAFSPSSEITYDELFEAVRGTNLLVLDDLGSENTTPWAEEKLYQIINHRYNSHMPTVITTNNDLIRGLDERIHSRLVDRSLTNTCIIDAPDFRKQDAFRQQSHQRRTLRR